MYVTEFANGSFPTNDLNQVLPFKCLFNVSKIWYLRSMKILVEGTCKV